MINIEIILLFMIFNLRFQKEIFYQMLGNKKMIEYIYKIINNNPTLFKISLNKENLNMLIKKTESYNEIINILSYNNNFLDLLEVIYNNKVLLSEIIIREKKFLNLGEYVNPKDSDDLNKIYGQILLLLNFEKKYDKYFIEFGDKLINNYINLFKDNFDNIILLYKIKKLIKEKNSFISFENYYNNIQYIIKKKYQDNKDKMNNDQLLKYIENIGHLKYTELSEIINNFNISSMGTDFFSKWKNVDWMNLFKNKKIDEKEFYKAVCNKINEIKYFGLLFELFDINNIKKDYSIIMIQYMQEKFQYLIINKPGLNEYTIFIEDVSNLIFYSEIKKINSIGIIKNIVNLFNSFNIFL